MSAWILLIDLGPKGKWTAVALLMSAGEQMERQKDSSVPMFAGFRDPRDIRILGNYN